MIRLVLYLLVILGLMVGLHWLADRPGTVTVEWLGYVAETSVFRALVILAALLAAVLLTWSALRGVWRSPAALGRYLHRRRQQRGLDAITGGIIAVSAGDRAQAIRYASQARKALPHEPLTHLLRAQAAQIGGDRATARRIFEAMLAQPDTEQLGLRGLFLEAEREGEREAARQFAERALQKNPKLGWPVESLFDLQCRGADWQGALATLEIARWCAPTSAPSLRKSSTLGACACFTVLPSRARPRLARARGIGALERRFAEAHLAHATVEADQLAQRQLAAAPELDVRLVAERADHQDAGALLGVGVR